MDFETSGMEFEIKDEVKEENIDEILKEAQEAIENANLESKAEDAIDIEDLICPPPPPTFAVELNAVETEFDGSPEKGPRNSISKARLICPHCPKSFPTRKSLEKHSLNLHGAEHDKRVELSCVTCAGRKFNDKKSRDEHIKQFHINNASVLLSRDRSLLESPHCPIRFLVQKDLNSHVESEHTDPLEIDPLSTTTPSVGTETTLKISTTRHKHKCPHCPFTFLLSQNLQEHIIKIHVKHKAFPCHICANLKRSKVQSFIDQQSLSQHIKSCHVHGREGEPDQRVKCPHCPSTFASDYNLQQHIIKLHVKHKAFPCHVCASLKKPQVKSFISQNSLDLHLRRCHGHVPEEEPAESQLKCPQCEKTYSQNSHLADHIKDIHNGPRLWEQCPQCPLSFTSNQALKSHLISWHKEPCENTESEMEPGLESQQKCPHCDITLSGKSSLAVHIEQVHSESQPCLKCPHCPFVFLLNQNLQEHIIKFHAKQYKAFPCHICANLNKSKVESFIDQQSLSQHIKSCHGHAREGQPAESRLKCPHCDKTYSRKGHLTYHIKFTHSGPVPRVQCPECLLSFARNSALRRHRNKCGKKLCESTGGETEPGAVSLPKCPHCDKTLSSKSSLIAHIKQVHSESQPRIKCPHCPFTFSLNQARKIHIKRFHKEHRNIGSVAGEGEPETGVEPLLKCCKCEAIFPQESLLRQHVKREHSSFRPGIKCPCCPLIFAHKMTLKNHIFKLHKEHSESCKGETSTTAKASPKRNALITKCRYCNKTFLNAKELRNHIIEIHIKQKKTAEKHDPPNPTIKQPSDCNNKNEIENSDKNQCQPPPRVQCPKCPSTFSNSKHLQFHIMLLHAEKKEFPCLICTSRNQEGSSNSESGTEMKSQHFIFDDEFSLKQHMKNIHYSTHKQKQNLQEPEKVRILKIPENKICSICSKSFDGKWAASSYRSHMQTHLDIKRYSCEHCSKKFATKISLHSHLIRYHNYSSEQLNFKNACQLCPFITTSQLVFNYHMGVKHPNSNDRSQSAEEIDVETAIESNFSRNIIAETNPTESAVCFVCSKIQTSKRNLIQHLKEHRGEGRFFCDLCPRDYSLRMSLLIHLKMDHHKLAYCNNCFTSFTDAAAFNQHILHIDGAALNSNPSENGNSRASNLRCEICDTIFKSPCLFRIHTISHVNEIQQQELNFADDEVVSADNIFKCSVCPKVFDRQSYVNAHLEIVHETPQESSRFQCDKCERNYKFISELKYHYLLTHSSKINQQVNQNHSAAADGEFDFKCDVCLIKFGTESELTDHQDKFRSEVLCHICAAKFKFNTALVLHLKRVHKTDNYSYKHLCHICPSKFFNGKELRSHVERVHEGKNQKRRWYEIAEKNIDHRSETLRKCNSNNKAKLINKNRLNRGRNKNKAKITTKSVMCFVCSEMQSTKGNLMLHLKEHRGERRAYCDLCPRDYLDRFYLMAHLKWNHHRLANCNKCFTSFADNEALSQHLLHVDVPSLNSNQTIESQAPENADSPINDADSPASKNENSPASNLKCEICGESFKSPCLFKIHLISHLKENQQQELNFPDDEVVSVDNIFKCSVCPSAFDRQSYLNAHLNIVHESSPESNHFECGKCEQTYKTQNELKFHYLVVHSLKINQHINQNQNHTSKVSDAKLAFECSTCFSKFLTQSELTNHEDIFEPKLSCHICSTKFKCKYSLKSHVRFVHGGKHLVCGICNLAKFSRGADLQTHVREVHEGKRKKRIWKIR